MEGAASRPLQHFEFALMLAVSNLGMEAYPAEITRELNKSLGRSVSLAQVFVALERLEDKGCVTSRSVTPERPTRGGRRRRVFQVEPTGARAIRVTQAAFNRPASASSAETSHGARARRREPAPA